MTGPRHRPSKPQPEKKPTSDDAADQQRQSEDRAAVSDQAEVEAQSHTDERQVEQDIDELISKAAQRDEYLSLAQRTQADFENYRRRMSKELADAQVRGVIKLAQQLLPALDNLERALVHSENCDKQFVDGIRLVQSELIAALEREGIESYSPKGQPFDPTWHEAMSQQPAEGVAQGTIIEVFQPGYRLNGTVLRPARVVVAG